MVDIPAPTPESSDYISGARRVLNALTESSLENKNREFQNKIAEAQAKYAPYTEYSNAASKLAYANFVGPQAILGYLNNPQTRGTLTPQQYKEWSDIVSNMLRNPNNALSQLPSPNAQNAPMMGSPRGDGLLGHIMNALRGGPSAQPTIPTMGATMGTPQGAQMNIPQDSGSAPQNALGTPAPGGSVPALSGAQMNALKQLFPNNNLRPQDAAPSPSPPVPTSGSTGISPTYTNLAQDLPAGTYGALSPASTIQAGEKGFEAQTTGEGKAIAEQWKEREDKIKENSEGAQSILNTLNSLREARSRLNHEFETGTVFGRAPAVSDAARDYDKLVGELISNKAKSFQTGGHGVTDKDLLFLTGLKPTRTFGKESFNNAVTQEEAGAKRVLEYPAFISAARRLRLTPSQADVIWARYANERPLFNPKTKKIIERNLDSWEDYLDPESIKETFSPRLRKQMQKNLSNMTSSTAGDSNEPSEEDINFTAQKYKITPAEVRRRLGLK